MTTRKPVLTNTRTSKTREQFLKELEERMRRNKGGFSTFAEPTGSSVAFRVPGRPPPVSPMRQPASLAQAQPVQREIQELPQMPQVQGASSGPSVQEFIQAFTDSILAQDQPSEQLSTEQQEYIYQMTGQTYGVATMEDGSVLMNDGSTKIPGSGYGDQWQGQPPKPKIPGSGYGSEWEGSPGAGIPGFMSGLFGQKQQITQSYGNYNPSLYKSGYHQGTDFRTRDLQNRNLAMPVSAKVVKVLTDDGYNPYGNSVLLQLSSGEMLRLSHFAQLGNFKEGDTLQPGQFLGIPGSTGNSTGEHLDVEYYNAKGQIGDLANFSGFSNPVELIRNEPIVSTPQETPYFSQEKGPDIKNYAQPEQPQVQPQAQPQAQQSEQPILQQAFQGTMGDVAQLGQTAKQEVINPLARSVGQLGSKGNLPEFGLSEQLEFGGEKAKEARRLGANLEAQRTQQQPPTNPLARAVKGIRQFAGNTAEGFGDAIPWLKEGYWSEAIAGGPTKHTGQAFAAAPQSNIEGSQQVQRPEFNLQDAAKDSFQNLKALQPGEGIKSFASNLFSKGKGIFSRPGGQDIEGTKAVGNLAGGQMTPSMTRAVGVGEVDIRDPFFKSGLMDKFAGVLKPAADQLFGGAISLDMFKPEFFNEPEAQKEVFGGTHLASQAQEKYDELGKQRADEMKKEFIDKYMSGQIKFHDQADAQRILNSLPSVVSSSFALPEPRRRQISLQEYLDNGKTIAQYYAETGQQGALDAAGGPDSLARDMASSGGGGGGQPQYYGGSTPETQAYQSDKAAGGISGGKNQNFTPAYANYTNAFTGQPAYSPPPQKQQSQPKQNSNVFNKIKNFFRGFF